MQSEAAETPGRPLVAQKPARVQGNGVGKTHSQCLLPSDSRRVLGGSLANRMIRFVRGQSLGKWGGAGLPQSTAEELR